MDPVRFGRALGFGARQAAKTVAKAVDAATAENPGSNTNQASPALTQSRQAPLPHSAKAAAAGSRGSAQAKNIRRGLTNFRDSTVEPVVRLSGVLWLELMGVFFGLFALSAATALWRIHSQWKDALAHPSAHASFVGAVIISALFAYFSLSSFLRARRRERRRG